MSSSLYAESILDLLNNLMDSVRAQVSEECMVRLMDARRSVLETEAQARRDRCRAHIELLPRIDHVLIELEFDYERIRATLNKKGREAFVRLIERIKMEREQIVRCKQRAARHRVR